MEEILLNKVLLIGIDSMDSELLSKFIDDMPNFKKLKDNSPDIKMESVFPPDSDTAWASIYTGLNPAKHGVVTFVDPIEKSYEIQTKESEADYIMGKTFWDYNSLNGKKSIVLLPHIAYPPWKIDGIMLSRSRIYDKVKSQPDMDKNDLDKVNSPKGVPKKDKKSLQRFANSYKELIYQEKNLFIDIIKNNEWDLFFCYSSSLDAIQHYFWNFCDENSPDYIINSPFKDIIKEFYIIYDSMIGEIISLAGKNTTVIVMSDHGHQGRPQKLVNINEILRQHGFINASNMNAVNTSIEDFKSKSIEWVSKYNVGWIASKILKIFPQFMNFYLSNQSINFNLSVAYVTDLSGIKAYTYGGIKIKELENYEDIRNKIIDVVKNELKEKLVFISKREELYDGKYLSKYPDIIIQLKDDYGLGNKINVPIITEAHTSNIVPGSHRKDTPIFFLYNHQQDVYRNSIELVDIAPTILDILKINDKITNMDGNSIFGEENET